MITNYKLYERWFFDKEGYKTNLSTDEFVQLFKEHNLSFDDKPIYRGINEYNSNKKMLIDPKKGKRRSAHTSNFYTTLIDNLPVWKDYPQRSRSLICTTSTSKAKIYDGGIFRIFPVDDNINIGVCPEYDIWLSFLRSSSEITPSINPLNLEVFNHIMEAFDDSIYELNDKNYKELIKGMKKINFKESIISEKLFKYFYDKRFNINDKLNNDKLHIIFAVIKKYDTVYDFAIDFLDPIKNRFQHISYNEYKNRKDLINNEIWTDSKCLVINTESSDYENIINWSK